MVRTMRSYLIIPIFLSGIVLARYHEKTRFDRSIHNEYKVENIENNNSEKQWSFTDKVKQFVAYKSKEENDCYLENIKQDTNVHNKQQSKIFYTSRALTKLEAWQLVGDRIINFCKGRNIILLQETRPISMQILDLFQNKISVDENDISSRQEADVMLTPLIIRMKKQVQYEQQKKLKKSFNQTRQRRQVNQFRGKFRGQTQSQYLNIGNNEQKEGKAEAEATQQSSHARVIGNYGMGQAQSMSSGDTGCEDCIKYSGYSGIEGVPDISRISHLDTVRPVQGPGVDTSISGIARPGTEAAPGGAIYPGSIISNGQIYPHGVQPGTVTSGRDGAYLGHIPGAVRPKTDGIYPGSIPEAVRPKADGTYFEKIQPVSPEVVHPGTVILGNNRIYSNGAYSGIIRPGGDGTYAGSIRPEAAITPETVRPGIHLGTMTPDRTYPSGIHPGIIRPGSDVTYLGTSRPEIAMPSGDKTYPLGTVTGRPILYPGQSIQPVSPITVTTEARTDAGIYPGSIQPIFQQGQGTYRTDKVPLGATAGIYPSGIAAGVNLPSGMYPGSHGTLPIGTDGIYPITGTYLDGIRPGTVPTTDTGTYPGGVVPEQVIHQRTYSGDRQTDGRYSGIVPDISPGKSIGFEGQMPSTVTTTGSAGVGTQVVIYPGGRLVHDQTVYPHPGHVVQPGKIPDGTRDTISSQIVYPDAGALGRGTVPIYPAGRQPQIVYPGGTRQNIPPLMEIPGALYPNQRIHPTGRDRTVQYAGNIYPGVDIRTPVTDVSRRITVPGEIQYPISIAEDGQYRQYPGGIGGQEVGITPVKPPPELGGPAGTKEVLEYGTGRQVGIADNDAESQALSSVQQIDSGTQASASAHGKYGQGTAQSQVTGIYSGSGTFSAQAGTIDANKKAQAEISGGKNGAMSNAEGIAGYGKSQTQVQLDSDSGTTSTGAQSNGWNHDTMSQVQASSKGGMADSQANGDGSTSSQAQIGFQPYLGNDEKIEKHATPFRGSGTASAQSGTHTGQSQSQLQGSFQYGITYTGAAQAGAGSNATSSRKPFNFTTTDTNFFKPFHLQDSLKNPASTNNIQLSPSSLSSKYDNRQNKREHSFQSSSTSRQDIIMNTEDNLKESATERKTLSTEKPQTDDASYDEYDDEYADEYDDITTGPSLSSNTRAFMRQRKFGKIAQRQNPRAQTDTKEDRYDINVKQDSNASQVSDILQPGQSLSGYTIPPGFRGRVMSISNTNTIAQGNNESQSQTVSLTPKDFNNTKPFVTETRSLQTNYERHLHQHISNNKSQTVPSIDQDTSSNKRMRPTSSSIVMNPSYYSVTNSVAGKMNGNNASRKYEHRYYTKSSTCGYFTFSCNVVYGSNGRTKICKPKVPTYSDGTPIKC